VNHQQLQLNNCINNCKSTKNKDFIFKRKGRPGQYQREIVEKFYKKQTQQLDSLPIIYSKEEVSKILNDKEYNYTKYFGKAKNRTMLKENPHLYKALYFYTDFYKNNCRNSNFYFTFRLLIAGKYNFNLIREQYCRCGKYITFDPILKQIRKKSYCKTPGCTLSANSPNHFKYLYGENWEKKYYDERIVRNMDPERKKRRQLGGRIAYQKRMSRTDTKFHCIGKREKELLDKQEQLDNCIIDRFFTVIGYYPDGYCHETNTIYEVYEKHHKRESTKERDLIRQKEIQNHLKCDFKIIWDDEN